jgi:hypothetical protein
MQPLTFFSIPKPFTGPTDILQRNAIRSWTLLHPGSEILLFGDEEGTEKVAREWGLRHVLEVAKNRFGTPLVSDVFEKAQSLARHERLVYVNADIVFLEGFNEALRELAFSRYLMVGRRWDLDVSGLIDFESSTWRHVLASDVRERGLLHGETGIDYFAFPLGLYGAIPPFAVGRTAWDNWLIYAALAARAAVIDATEAVTVVHQNHGYRPELVSSEGRWSGPEAEENLRLAGDLDHCFTIADADWRLTKEGLQRVPWSAGRLARKVATFPVLREADPFWGRFFKPWLAVRLRLRQAARSVRVGRRKVF